MDRKKKMRRWIPITLMVLSGLFLALYLLQSVWVHRKCWNGPDYDRVLITEKTDEETLFLQTGLGPAAIEKLIKSNQFDVALRLQDALFEPEESRCVPLLGWFTREDRRTDQRITLVGLQPGDILLTFSTHSAGWRHGHAGLVLDENTVLESVSLGQVSEVMSAEHWTRYSDFALLRVKGVDDELRGKVVHYAKENMVGVSYRLLSGLIGEKAMEENDPLFGAHCSYLIWYIWNRFGVDLDSDGGRLVTCNDLLNSSQVEVIQIYGTKLHKTK